MRTLALILISAISLASSSAFAASYTYTGNFYSGFEGFLFGTTDFVQASLSFDAPLEANRTLADVQAVAGFTLTMSGGSVLTLSSDGQVTGPANTSGGWVLNNVSAQVATDSDGRISAWQLGMSAYESFGGGHWISSSSAATQVSLPGGSQLAFDDVLDATPFSPAGDQFALASDAPGVWVDTVDRSLVPEPSTALLMGLGLAGLAARRR